MTSWRHRGELTMDRRKNEFAFPVKRFCESESRYGPVIAVPGITQVAGLHKGCSPEKMEIQAGCCRQNVKYMVISWKF